MAGQIEHVDVLVIGGGVVGCAILREVSRLDCVAVLVEARPDICDGTSKSNSGIVHTGFDAPPGTLESRLLRESRDLWPQVIADLHIPYLQTGAVMVSTCAEETRVIREQIIPKANQNGVSLVDLTSEELRDGAPYLTDRTVGGILIEGEGVIDPFWTTRAYAENAVINGARVCVEHAVTSMEIDPTSITVHTSAGTTFVAAVVVNAAGLYSDSIARLAGDVSFTISPRKGEFIITEEEHGIGQIVLPVPSAVSKGILVTPIIFGGIMLGPTAEDVQDKSDLATTDDGLHHIRNSVRTLVPSIADASSIRQFAGLRAVSSTGGYVIGPSQTTPRLINACGIRSTGISASPAIGRHVATLVKDILRLSTREDFQAELPEFLADARPDEGDVVCLCRAITRSEVLAAMRAPLPPTTLDGLKRRTGVMLGECQGNICTPALLDLFASEHGRSPRYVRKNVAGSELIVGAASDVAV